ncbi:MAG TPA: inositol monophosphatase family protein [Vitreimonas sp.]|uniref:3'(2'),5'-bisphosphate nucleotidase CysQ family protein n=1 Tax=Vitreimonas sp. TaxID=3069702 RepID=UPI002D2B939D|nr:inositol monophosphatase family protein [Vitreimonas sp.]HYD88970.1 inositol monophosphatase family protein [Vitreimonas sp.]
MSVQLDSLIALALAAGREINAVREAGFEAQTKLDGSLVTIADQRAEAIIEQGLRELAPNVPMIGEEAVAEGRIPECGDRWFCVDPLDGTKGFAKGGDEFTVNIALIENGLPTLGVVYAPASGEMFAGEPNAARTARCDPHTAEIVKPFAPMVANTAATRPWRIIASENSGRDVKTAGFIGALEGVPAHASSSIKFCRIAEGAADLYPRFGEVSEWDAAAGHAILNAAGGGIMRLDGAPLIYGDRAGGFLIRGFVAYANDAAREAALAALT